MTKYIKVIGGLGNQLFQFAFYLFLKKNGFDVRLDISMFKTYKLHNGFELQNIIDSKYFHNNLVETTNKFRSITDYLHKHLPLNVLLFYNERPKIRFQYNRNVLSGKFKYYYGYYQTVKYVEPILDELLTTILLPNFDSKNSVFVISA